MRAEINTSDITCRAGLNSLVRQCDQANKGSTGRFQALRLSVARKSKLPFLFPFWLSLVEHANKKVLGMFKEQQVGG